MSWMRGQQTQPLQLYILTCQQSARMPAYKNAIGSRYQMSPLTCMSLL